MALVVVIVADDRDHALKAGDQIVHQGGFAAARAPGNADDQNVVVHNLFLHIYFSSNSFRDNSRIDSSGETVGEDDLACSVFQKPRFRQTAAGLPGGAVTPV